MYGWIITEDHLREEAQVPEVGIVGPRDITDEDIARLKVGEGFAFELYDDDGEKYYTGRLVVSGDATPFDEDVYFAPLDDFGAPGSGCTEIRWPGHPESVPA